MQEKHEQIWRRSDFFEISGVLWAILAVLSIENTKLATLFGVISIFRLILSSLYFWRGE